MGSTQQRQSSQSRSFGSSCARPKAKNWRECEVKGLNPILWGLVGVPNTSVVDAAGVVWQRTSIGHLHDAVRDRAGGCEVAATGASRKRGTRGSSGRRARWGG